MGRARSIEIGLSLLVRMLTLAWLVAVVTAGVLSKEDTGTTSMPASSINGKTCCR